MTKVSVVIPVYNQFQLTERCLGSLLEHSSLLQEVIVVDNASQDQTAVILKGFQHQFEENDIRFQIITNSSNQGFGRACNQGIRQFFKGNAPSLAILNNDTWLMPQWDQALLRNLERHHLDCVGPYFYEKPFSESVKSVAAEFVKKNGDRLRRHFVPILMFFTRSAIEKLSKDCPGSHGGIFDERFFVTYEDADLLKRMRLLRLRYGQTGACFIWHHSKGTRSQAPDANRHEVDGHRIFLEKWGFDPRPHQDPFFVRLRRRYWKFLERHGKF